MTVNSKLLSSMEKVFIDEMPAAPELTELSALKGEQVSFQLALCQFDEERVFCDIKITSDLPAEISVFEIGNIPVNMPCFEARDDNYLRTLPGLYPDILNPITRNGFQLMRNQCKSAWLSVKLPENTEAKDYNIKVELLHGDDCCVEKSLRLRVINANLPEQKLIFTQWMHCDCIASYYGCEIFSEKHWELIGAFMKNAVDFGVNMILVPLLTPPLDTEIGKERPTVQLVDIKYINGDYVFKLDKLDRFIKLAKAAGYKYFEINHLFTQWGALHAPKVVAEVDGEIKKIFGWETDHNDPEYIRFLNALLTELKKKLREYGIFENTFFHISDEPSTEAHKATYTENTHNLSEVLSDCQTIDALTHYEFYRDGLVKRPVPAIDKIKPFIENDVPELWGYYCCLQGNLVSNHFVAMPGERTRILSTALFKYKLHGFLHWGFNFYYSQLSKTLINPFSEASAVNAFPAGDAFIVYPGADGKPISSQRQYLLREAFQDLRAMELLEKLSDYSTVLSIIEEYGEISFDEYPKSSEKLLDIREKINLKIAELKHNRQV